MSRVETSAVEESVRQLRAVLADVDAGQLTCSAATRHRIEGAILALDTVSSAPEMLCSDEEVDPAQGAVRATNDRDLPRARSTGPDLL